MAIFSKLDNAFKRSEELIKVGQKQEALQVLHDVITSRRYRLWEKRLETVMFKYVELCVDMRQGRFAKDGLIQYRNVCQQVNIHSLEEVIKHFMQLATERAELAYNQAQALDEALDTEDLEADKRPEDLMFSYVSGENGKDRSDRELVAPWFKFLWETYRTVLEISRNNSKLEALYEMTAHRAFQFCKQYKQAAELRRLGEIIRNHLENLNKYRDQRDRLDLSVPESLQSYLDTRFEQLKVTTELELWQEAFHSVEDIHGLMCMVKKAPKSSLMNVYYAKLTEIFWKSSSHLYHAYAWLKLFSLQKGFNENLSQKDLQLIACSVVLAALSVPLYNDLHGASHLEIENEKERNLKVSNLIAFDVEPKAETGEALSRSSLLAELVSKGVVSCATQEVKDLYHLLEHGVIPLNLASKVQPLLNKISKLGGKISSASSVPEVQLSQYVPALEKLSTLRLLQQASQVYQTLKIENLSKMTLFFDFASVEEILVDAVKHNFISLKVDHMQGAVFFSQENLESDGLCDRLALFAESLSNARAMVYPHVKKAHKIGEALSSLTETVENEHRRILARKSVIEKHKEEQERQLLEMEREEESKRLKLQKLAEEAEKRRLASEYEQRKIQRILKEKEERDLEEVQTLLKHTKRKQKKILEGEKVTTHASMEIAIREQLREKQETEKKLQKLARTMDHLERAKREEGSLLIVAAFQSHLVEEAALHEREQQNEIDVSKQRHAGDLEKKQRLARMLNDKEELEAVVKERRDRITRERQDGINQMAQTRKQEREIRRKMIYYLQSEEKRFGRLHTEEEARDREAAAVERGRRAARHNWLRS